MVRKRVVTLGDVEHLPTEIHKKIARQLIVTGEWELSGKTKDSARIPKKKGG